MTPILAHGTGLDDVAAFVVIALLSLVALRSAERRARRRAALHPDPPDGPLSSSHDE